MNINVVKSKNGFIKSISNIFSNKNSKYIRLPASVFDSYIENNFKLNNTKEQDISGIVELVNVGEISIEDLTVEEIEKLNDYYINENKKLS